LEFSLDVVESLRGDAERRRSGCFAWGHEFSV